MDRAAFETQLRAAFEARDLDAWNAARLIYGDWLQERDNPLQWAAKCDSRHYANHPFSDPTRRPWGWALRFVMPRDWNPRRYSRWVRKRNEFDWLGIPAGCLRCTGFHKEFFPVGDAHRMHYVGRFQVRFEYGLPFPDLIDFTRLFWPRRDYHDPPDEAEPVEPAGLFAGA